MTKPPFLKIAGREIPIISDDDAENVDFLVCSRARDELLLPDNFVGECCVCGVKVEYRWHAPRKPKRICMECAIEQMQEEQAKK